MKKIVALLFTLLPMMASAQFNKGLIYIEDSMEIFQDEYSRYNEIDIKSYYGMVVFNDNSILNCNFTINLHSLDVIVIQRGHRQEIYDTSKIKSYSFFDPKINENRIFISVPVKANLTTKSLFFELRFDDSIISILERYDLANVEFFYDRYARKHNLNSKFLFDHRDNTIYACSEEEILRLTQDKKVEIKNFIKENNLHLRKGKTEDFVIVINYYRTLKSVK